VEVFNESLRRALGNVEIFADSRPAAGERFVDLRRVGLDQPAGAWRAARALLRRHQEEPFDVVLSNGVYGWPLTIARPCVPMVQVYHFTLAGLARRALTLRGDRLTASHVTGLFDRIAGIGKHVVVVSQPVRREVEAYYGFQGRLIPNAVDMQAFTPADPASAREALGIPPGVAVGLFVGRPDHTKGYDVLLQVARRLPNVLFLVVGGDAGGTGNVRSLGRIAHEAMPQIYSASDFFFLPSRYEGFSLALLEALSCNLPVVLSESAWPFSEEPLDCGVVVRSDSERDFVQAIRLVLAARDQFSPREFISPRCNFAIFERTWRGFIQSVLSAA
jgi:glycosyltransferase involved in cell wall biosynthesis